jgi:hypothetical protein
MPQLRDNYKYRYIDSATTTQIYSGQGQLVRIVVGETAAGAISIIDNTSGSTVNIGTLKASIAEGTYDFGVQFATGLRIITAATSKITVVYAPNLG